VDYHKLRDRSRTLLWPFVFVYLKFGIHPNFITLLGLILSLLTGYFYKMGLFVHAAVSLLFSGICDATDGEVARRTGRTTALGAFLAETRLYPVEAVARAIETARSPKLAEAGIKALNLGAALAGPTETARAT